MKPCPSCQQAKEGCSQLIYGVAWAADYGENATHNCEDFMHDAVGVSWWFCDPVDKSFLTPRPDRSACKCPWVAEVVDMVEDNSTSAFKVSRELVPDLE